jgi:hypothetical protein
MLVKQARPEIGAVVVIAHRPDDLRSKVTACGLHDRAELGIGLGVALVGQVTGKDHGFRASAGGLNLVEELDQAGFAVNCAV